MGNLIRLLPISLLILIAFPSFAHADIFGKAGTVVEETVETVESIDSTLVESQQTSTLDKAEKTTESLVQTAEESSTSENLPVHEVKQAVQRTVTSGEEGSKQAVIMVEVTVNKTISETTATVEKVLAPKITKARDSVKPIAEAVGEKDEALDSIIQKTYEQVPSSANSTPVEEEDSVGQLEETQNPEKRQVIDASEPEGVTNENQLNLTNSLNVKQLKEEEIDNSHQRVNDLEVQVMPFYDEQPEKEKKPATIPPVTNGNSKAVINAPVFSPNSFSMPSLHAAGQDLGQYAWIEYVVLDEAVGRQWRNPEEIGSSQWIHAPPTKPPMPLSFLMTGTTKHI